MVPNQTSRTRSPELQRLSWLDIAKGVGICLVVWGHAFNGLIAAGLVSSDSLSKQAYYTVYTFHMPLFFFLGGLTALHSLRHGPAAFLQAKGWSILYPYVVWSLLQGFAQTLASSSLNHQFDPAYMLFILSQPIGHFWFLYALMIAHMICALTKGRKELLILSAAMLAVASDNLPGVLGQTAFYFPYYAAGIVADPFLRHPAPQGRHVLGMGALALAACVAIGLLVGPATTWSYVSLAILPAAAMGIAGVVLVSQGLASSPIAQIAAYLGRQSLVIYLMHVLACAGTRVLLMKLGLTGSPAALIIVTTLAGVTLPLLAHAIFQRLHLLEVLGLDRGAQTWWATQAKILRLPLNRSLDKGPAARKE